MIWIITLSILLGMFLAGGILALIFSIMIASSRRELEAESLQPPHFGP